MDRKAKSLLVGFVGDDCLAIVEEKETAKEMWKALEDRFAEKSGVSQTILRKRLETLRMKEGSSMRNHHAEFDDLERQLMQVQPEDYQLHHAPLMKNGQLRKLICGGK
uniref:Uncharacterized protein n=1 Tax=Anopheles quadriannulatus TaxID=34691 RepID=A0A182XPT7_ANOQN